MTRPNTSKIVWSSLTEVGFGKLDTNKIEELAYNPLGIEKYLSILHLFRYLLFENLKIYAFGLFYRYHDRVKYFLGTADVSLEK